MSDSHTFDPTILREYDIRGVIGDTLNAADYTAVGRAFGTLVVRDGGTSVAVGYDGRLHSPDMEAALVKGLVSTGLTVKRIGRGPTPMLYYAAQVLETDAGMMVTGSHNPPNYNGIKMLRKGKSFYGAQIQGLGPQAAAGDFVTGQGKIDSRRKGAVAAPENCNLHRRSPVQRPDRVDYF